MGKLPCIARHVLEMGPSPRTHCRHIESALTRSSVTRTCTFEKLRSCTFYVHVHGSLGLGSAVCGLVFMGCLQQGLAYLGPKDVLCLPPTPDLEFPAKMEIEHSIFLGCFESNCIASSFIFLKVSQR